ncbi:monofunctional biosynthetic peptidoglycan transglycosylase [Mucilaginibacter gotjawali]|uniref:Biosynthetic peptidoglycan transglycosylase n=2 Tax=Mucilaginibacter gotjawali TaxID=1550579 RepID=A0A0X8X5K9_9SPHI|nr:monofunctional biosynthetic peptidoglycan transglycosylase [Mucilaginibacter gotjawali]MBB3058348.1 monofunctional biosynthetic peptidoglycan transglycosylase [Mucilaginibacter gotjawali]BAU55532.1 Penicillin-binding protein 2D [Mucilaginibacter gotjawali]
MKTSRAKVAPNRKSGVSNSKGIFKGGIFRLIFRILKLVIIVFVVGSVFFVVLFRFVNPPVTYLMIERGFERKSAGKEWKIDKKWINFDEIADPMKRAAVAAEDQKFLDHFGFDFKAMEAAIDKNAHSHKLQGGSTISQQTAKNIFLWQGRSYLRKGLEAWFTILIETFWSKKRIMEVYLNEIEMGDGIYGVEAASQAYFHKSAHDLNNYQAAAIASIWPDPLKWSATDPSDYVRHRQYLIRKNMRRLGPLDF